MLQVPVFVFSCGDGSLKTVEDGCGWLSRCDVNLILGTKRLEGEIGVKQVRETVKEEVLRVEETGGCGLSKIGVPET